MILDENTVWCSQSVRQRYIEEALSELPPCCLSYATCVCVSEGVHVLREVYALTSNLLPAVVHLLQVVFDIEYITGGLVQLSLALTSLSRTLTIQGKKQCDYHHI